MSHNLKKFREGLLLDIEKLVSRDKWTELCPLKSEGLNGAPFLFIYLFIYIIYFFYILVSFQLNLLVNMFCEWFLMGQTVSFRLWLRWSASAKWEVYTCFVGEASLDECFNILHVLVEFCSFLLYYIFLTSYSTTIFDSCYWFIYLVDSLPP